MHKDIQTAQDLEIVKQTLYNRLPLSLLNSIKPYQQMTFSSDEIEYN
ncbi:6836_t:CDS:1, partial [Cetraspora pellucida]